MAPESLERRVTSKAFSDGPDNHAERRRWLLVGPEGATQFVTDWYPPASRLAQHVHRGVPRSLLGSTFLVHADRSVSMAVDLGHHSPRPLYPDMPRMDECDVLDIDSCWYEGSSLTATELARVWAKCGYDEEVIWSALEARYADTFLGDRVDDASLDYGQNAD